MWIDNHETATTKPTKKHEEHEVANTKKEKQKILDEVSTGSCQCSGESDMYRKQEPHIQSACS